MFLHCIQINTVTCAIEFFYIHQNKLRILQTKPTNRNISGGCSKKAEVWISIRLQILGYKDRRSRRDHVLFATTVRHPHKAVKVVHCRAHNVTYIIKWTIYVFIKFGIGFLSSACLIWRCFQQWLNYITSVRLLASIWGHYHQPLIFISHCIFITRAHPTGRGKGNLTRLSAYLRKCDRKLLNTINACPKTIWMRNIVEINCAQRISRFDYSWLH